LRIALLKLANLAVSAPAHVAVSGSHEIYLGEVLKIARGIEARRQFASERLVVNKTISARRADGLLI